MVSSRRLERIVIPGNTSSQGKKPSTPTIGTPTSGQNTQVPVAFTASAYIGKGTITYTATSSPGGFTGSGASSPVTVGGLTNGTSYTFIVTAVTNYGVSSDASSASAAATPYTVPTAPTSLAAIPTNTNVAISFTAPTNDGGSAITNYEYSFNGSSWAALSPADSTSPITVSSLTQNTVYSVYLRAVNVVGSGAASTAVTFTTAGVPTGTTTISSVSSITTTTATVNFSTTAGGGAITGYDYYLSSWLDAGVSSSPKNLTGLTAGTGYAVYMRPKNAYGIGSQSAGVGFTTLLTYTNASGGNTVSTYSSGGFNYKYHVFTGSGTFVVSAVGTSNLVDFLVLAGGGGGGKQHSPGGGGGSGGYRTSMLGETSGRGSSAESRLSVSVASYSITIGGGGSGGNNLPSVAGTVGGSSIFSSITSSGGGTGEGNSNGGSGGGAAYGYGLGYGTSGQGGDGASSAGYRAGGGGGASGGGSAGNGGNGNSSLITGSSTARGGGGAGSNYYAAEGTPGSGGGGTANSYSSHAGNGGTNLGGGGGGGFVNSGYSDRWAGNGGSGVVIIRYVIA